MVDKVAWVTLTNGRKDYMEGSRPSWYLNLRGNIYREVIVDTSYDDNYKEWLIKTYKSAKIISAPETLKKPNTWDEGIRSAYRFFFEVVRGLGCDFVFHLEDDFVLLNPVDLDNLVNILTQNKNIAQVYLGRQPWTKEEIDAGSVIKYCQSIGATLEEKASWVEHRTFFTFNPSLYRNSIAYLSLDLDNNPERSLTAALFSNPLAKTAVLGSLESPHTVEHIGRQRLW